MESTARLMAHEIIDAHQQARWRVPSRRRAACFGQARREANEFIAFLKLGIALDVLAKGGRAGGILALARAVFDKADNDVIASDNRLPLFAMSSNALTPNEPRPS